jgi:hypothetical protein
MGFYAFLIFMVAVDLAPVNKRYFTEDNYRRSRDNSFFAKTAADQEILKDKSHYRVYNLSYLTGNGTNTFAEARTSYYHQSVGGYHGAKLRRYEEFYDSCIVAQTQEFVGRAQKGNMTFENLPAINMLNIKYVYIGPGSQDVLPNASAYGNAWFVTEIRRVGSATEELANTCSANTRTVAVIDTSRFRVANIAADTSATIKLVDASPRQLRYESQSSADGLAVFSEIYYPGWEATIDGKPVEPIRADYILRALEIPAGSHTVEFTFRPKPYIVGNKITSISSWLVLLVLIGSIVWSVRNEDPTATIASSQTSRKS